MNPFVDLISGNPDQWLETLPEYQRSSLQDLLSSGKTAEEVAEVWLLSAAADQTAPFGARDGKRVYFTHFLNELHDLLCSDQSRETQRAAVLDSFKSGQTSAVAAITAAISPHLSSAPAFLAPAVAVVLCGISTVGLGAWCKAQSERRAASGPVEATE